LKYIYKMNYENETKINEPNKPNKKYLKNQEILKKYKHSIPFSSIMIPNTHFRILCKEYKVRYRLPRFYSGMQNEHFIRLLKKRKVLADILQNKIKQKWIEYTNQFIATGEECPICYDLFSETKYPITTFCMHTFCEKCILNHLKTNSLCPLCRSYIILNMIDEKYKITFQYLNIDNTFINSIIQPEQNQIIINEVQPENKSSFIELLFMVFISIFLYFIVYFTRMSQ
jgi:hypothetical protein